MPDTGADPGAAKSDLTLPWLRALLGARLGVDPAALDPDERLHRYGLTSLTAASIVALLADRLGRALPPTLLWDHPTLRRLAAFLDGRADPDGRAPMQPLPADEPIAIVGLACRLPGADGPAAFWRLLCDGVDAIATVPPARWPIDALYDPDPQAPGRMATRWGGFIDGVDQFDAAFFGMSPREAAQADPQQRLALELAWEALEDAGIRARTLSGSRTGVFMGAMWSDYARLLTDRAGIAQHTATGQDISIVSARIAYVLGLEGPALTIDTACSSALVAVHQACRSLRAGESTLALAGGVHLLLAPESSIAMTKFGAMAPDGRCKPFDARANGYVRGEGGGLVVLKPLRKAQADGDRIYAVIRGSAMNNDGPSNGLTAPNPAAQRGMLRDALADAQLDPLDVDYVEAHGTGTALGDPIEAQALAAVLCRGRPAVRALRVGSVKSNIGHLEAAAGAAGLIKLALSLQHRWIPASLHYRSPNPAIDFAGSVLAVQATGGPWPGDAERLIGGVSSFGFGGTNCHVLLQAVPAPVTACVGPVFVFAGNGGNWAGMARVLANEPVFAAELAACDTILATLGYPAPVAAVLDDARVVDVAFGQPALCAFQLALVALLASLGVMPAAVIGHSVGEAAAACVAGALTREQALRLVIARSRLQASVAGQGGMALAVAPVEVLQPLLPSDVVVAGENGPRATLLAGPREAVARVCAMLDAAGIVSQPIDVPVAYHSPQMDPLRPVLERDLADLVPASGTVQMVSTVTGAPIEATALDAAYWGRNLREPVRFRQGIAGLLDAGHRAFLELAPHPLLAAQIRQMEAGATVVSPLRRGQLDTAVLRDAVAPLASARTGRRPRHLLVLSAQSAAALDALRLRWAARLPEDWSDLCHTALMGRERFAWRLALHAAEGDEARRRLLAGDVLQGEVAPGAVQAFDQRRQADETWEAYLDRCAAAFVAGADIDGALFDADEPWRVVSAPTYPFERQRHWLPQTNAGLSYAVAWEPFVPADDDVSWPPIPPVADPPDPGLDAEATSFVHAALAAVPAAEIAPRHRALAERLARWSPLPDAKAGEGPVAALVRRTGQALPALLRGEADPLDVLFPGGDLEAAAAVYQGAPFAAAQRALAATIGALGRPLRVLELGAGTGALTSELLPKLPPGSAIISSDVSDTFLAGLRRRFADWPALRTARFDLDRPTSLDGPFDAIVAANVLHAGTSIGDILVRLRGLLAPAGVLGLVELVHAPRWIDLVFGLTEGWWRFRGDPQRPDHALLDPAGWRTALISAGFADIDVRPDGDAHAVILARAPATARRWAVLGQGDPTGLLPDAADPTDRLYCPGDAPAVSLVAELTAFAANGPPLTVLHNAGVPHAAVAGAVRALSLDRPDAIAASFELADRSEASLQAVHTALGRTGAEDQLRVVDGAVCVARLTRIAPTAPPPPLSADRLYVVAGGFGRLGRACTQFLIDRGARHLLLIGRIQGDPSGFATQGAQVRALALDLTAPHAAETLRAAFDRPLGGLVHAAGVADGTPEAVFAAKLDIAATLAQAADGLDPPFLLLFSSAAGVWGTRGHVAYAAANRALDRWAEQARARGLPATAIAFGRFQEPGLLSAEEDAALDQAGLRAMSPDDAFTAALQAVADGAALRIVAAIDWPRFRATFEARRRRSLFDRFVEAPAAPSVVVPIAPKSIRLDRAGVAALLADLLGHLDASRIDPERGLFEQGLDSLMAVTLRRRLEEAAGIPVPAAVLFAQPTVALLADWLAGAANTVPAAVPVSATHAPIAIVGLGCRFAGDADGPDAFLAQLLAGGDAIRPVPASRPTAALWHAAPEAVRLAGFLEGVEQFDAAFFGISPREAAQLDPQQRLLLEVAWRALEHAAIAPDRLNGSRTGVFVGATGSDYAALARSGPRDAHSLVGQPNNTLAGRLAYHFGLHGPALTLDTACSSSLVALHLAVRALRSGEADMALAGGVNLLLTPDTSMMLAQAGLLAPDGRCKVFDEAANGYVRGEGCGIAILKTLARAEADGDRVLAVIRGSAVNHDGRSSSFTAPNGAAQVAVIRDALADAGLSPDAIDVIEAHGTGTALGDPIELDALAEVFAGRDRPLLVGSVKAAIGHAEAAAGIAAVIKTVLCLNMGALPPQVHFGRRTPHARTDTPIAVATGGPLPAGIRRAGVSAFGASGTNAHVVLESVVIVPTERSATAPVPFDRQPFWLSGTLVRSERRATLGPPHRSARSGETVWETRLDPDAAWLRDHRVEGGIVLPAAGFLDLALAAGIGALTDVTFRRKRDVPPEGLAVQLVLERSGEVILYAEDADGWAEVATGHATILPLPLREGETLNGSAFAAELATRGFDFGPTYRTIRRLTRAAGSAGAELAADGPLDPPLIDAAIQTLSALLPPSGLPWLPAHIARVALGPEPSGALTVQARLRTRDDRHAIGDAWLLQADGSVALSLEGVELRPAQAEPGAWHHDVTWGPAATQGAAPSGRWHAIGPGAAALLCPSHDEAGDAPLPSVDGIIDLRPLTARTPAVCLAATAALVRAAAALPAPPQVVLVSRGASAAPPVLAGAVPAAAVLMGLQPVIEAEYPALRCRWVDLDPDDTAIPPALHGPAGRYALRHGRLLTPELVKAPPPPAEPVRLVPGPERSFADLRLVPAPEVLPAAGEVLIAVAAAGLNFKDVLTVLGRAPGDDPRLGLECAGTVVAVGEGVTHLTSGDPVLAFGPGTLASRVILPANRVLRRPDWLDADTAASLPVACLTAWHGLHDLAALRPGMRVLVHAGAGGVGSTAIRLARLAGAQVFATASAGKEAAARAAGAQAVGDSRSAAFAEAARRWAGPGGFDVVLNALGPEIAAASAALLGLQGIFLEIGSAPPPPGVARHVAYDLDQPMRADPGWFVDRMERVLALLRDGRLVPPRRTVLPLAQASEALQALGQGRTIGKLVMRLPQPVVLRADASYLITGGTGAVGQALGRWLLGAGAGRVVLAARHPVAMPGCETVAIDVTDPAALAALLRTLPDLRGVIHAAGVVQDATLDRLDPADSVAVLAPKADAAAQLDALTRDLPLDFFLLVSSTAGSLAAPGQASYASANAWLDRLAAARRAAGLPATAIGSGPWAAGMFARLDATAQGRLQRSGFRPMAPQRAAAAFAQVLADGAVHRLVMDRVQPSVEAAVPDGSIRAALLVEPPAERLRVLQAELAQRLVTVLGFPAGTRIEPHRALRDLGLDSLLSVSLRNELAAGFGLDLPATLVFDHPTLAALATHLLALLDAPGAPLGDLDEAELAALLEREL
ncbi:MAG: beta-ketoacyl synthase N-terminal-like domain-containing protein [Acetobacteraceae bacterium]|nr:beta-ketoacyl synthase N-terminal-like domain-containing protein [Acetobacteraceae bacterium]